DPLELDPGSSFGPPGFMQALRRHPNLSANAVGTAIIENRGLGPYLPALCRELLGEDLAIGDPPRWWMGDPQAAAHVFANPKGLAIRHAQEGTGRPGRGERGVMPEEMSPAQIAELKQKIRLHGSDYVAEQQVNFAATPSWTDNGFRAKPFAVRLYVTLVNG